MTFAVYDFAKKEVVNVEQIRIPAAFSIPDRLKYLRSNLLDVLREFKIEKAGVRVTEPFARNPSVERIQIEGVIQEAFASSELKAYYVGQISSISARVGIERNEFKPLVEGKTSYGVENWKGMSQEEREAILCAMGAVNV